MNIDPNTRLVGILTACPFGAPTERCELSPVRRKPLMDRMKWLSTLPEEERERLADVHRDCVICREMEMQY